MQGLADVLTCPICLNRMVLATETNCGHGFCAQCLTEYFQSSNQLLCPLCRKEVQIIHPSFSLRKLETYRRPTQNWDSRLKILFDNKKAELDRVLKAEKRKKKKKHNKLTFNIFVVVISLVVLSAFVWIIMKDTELRNQNSSLADDQIPSGKVSQSGAKVTVPTPVRTPIPTPVIQAEKKTLKPLEMLKSTEKLLMQSAWQGDTPKVQELLATHSLGLHVDLATKEGFTPLYGAAQAGHFETCSVLLEKGAKVDYIAKDGSTPLFTAVQHGRQNVANLLLQKGANPNVPTAAGTPLVVAAQQGFVDIVDLLLSHGAKINTKNSRGHTALLLAVAGGHVEVTKKLIQNGGCVQLNKKITKPFVDCRDYEMNETPLYVASRLGSVELVQLLIEQGKADIEASTSQKATPLYVACEYGKKRVVEYLLKKGAKANVRMVSGASPLLIAAQKGFRDIVQYIVNKQVVDIELTGAGGLNALHMAILGGHNEVAVLLLENGADPNTEGGEPFNAIQLDSLTGKSNVVPLQMAVVLRNVYLVSILLKYGADWTVLDETDRNHPSVAHLFKDVERVTCKVIPIGGTNNEFASMVVMNSISTLKELTIQAKALYRSNIGVIFSDDGKKWNTHVTEDMDKKISDFKGNKVGVVHDVVFRLGLREL